jgi:hypothetical protein
MTRTAHCSCGALRVEVSGEPDAVVACHCGECQRRTGSVFGVGAYFKKEHVQTEGPYNTHVRDAPEGRKVRNHFCPTCGTTVFWEADLRPDNIGVAVGTFGDSRAIGMGGVKARVGCLRPRSPASAKGQAVLTR